MTHPAAGDEELRKAYKRQRDIFQAGSSPLCSTERAASIERARIEEAHDTLLDARTLRLRPIDVSHRERQYAAPAPTEDAAVALSKRALLREELAHEIGPNTAFTGGLLRKVRESLGVELEEIA